MTRQLGFPLVDHELTSNFDADIAGWRVVGGGTAQWSGTGGNPGGFLRGVDGGSGVWYYVSPESWSGDWSLFKQIRFQMKFLGGAYGAATVDTVHLRTYAGQELVASSFLQAYAWTPYTFDLPPTNFGVDRATFDAAIRNVKELWIRGESTVAGDDNSGLDNVLLTKASSPYLVWRDQYWTSPDRDNESVAGVFADPDGDGANNWGEFTAGTIPTNRLDFFRIDSVTSGAGGCLVVLRSQPGRTYGLEALSGFGASSPWEVATNNLPGTGDLLTIPVEAGTSARFFRATVRRQD